MPSPANTSRSMPDAVMIEIASAMTVGEQQGRTRDDADTVITLDSGVGLGTGISVTRRDCRGFIFRRKSLRNAAAREPVSVSATR
jgi:hypothetical protein